MCGVQYFWAKTTDIHVLWWTAGINLLAVFLVYFRALLQAQQRFSLDGWASVADKSLLMLALLPLLWQGGLTMPIFLWLSLLTGGSAAGIFGLLTLKNTNIFSQTFPAKKDIVDLFKQSLPFAAIGLLFATNERINQIILERLAGATENGLYAGAYRWFAALSMYLWTVLPVFYAKFAAGTRMPVAAQQKLFHQGKIIVSLPIIWVCGFIVAHAEKMFILFTDSKPLEITAMATTLRILVVAMFVNGTFNIYSTYLTATGFEQAVNRLLIVAILLNSLTTVLLAPTYGALGAAGALSLSFCWLAGGYVYYFYKLSPLKVPLALSLKLLCVAFICWGSFAGLAHVSVWWLNSIVAGILLLVSAYLLRIITFERKNEPIAER